MKIAPFASVFATLAFGLCACNQGVDLSSVRTLAATTSAARPAYTEIARDYYDSCQRFDGWAQLATGGILTNAGGEAHGLVTAVPSPPAVPAGAPTVPPAALDAVQIANDRTNALIGTDDCDTVKLAATDWQHVNDAVLNYVAALGRVAGGGKATDFGFADLTANVPSLKKDQASALSGFLTTFSNQAFDAERRTDIAASATQADAALGTAIDFLTTAATEYKKVLARERGEIDTFYSENLGRPNVPAGIQRVGLVEFEVDWQAKLGAVDQKRAAADAYLASVRAIRTAHAGLVESATTNTWGNLFKIAAVFESDFQPNIEAIYKAFK